MKIKFINFRSKKFDEFLEFINFDNKKNIYRKIFPLSFSKNTIYFIWGQSSKVFNIFNSFFSIKSFYFEEGLLNRPYYVRGRFFSYFCCKDKPYFNYNSNDWNKLFKQLNLNELNTLSNVLEKNKFRNGKIQTQSNNLKSYIKTNHYIIGQIDNDESLKSFSNKNRSNFSFIKSIKKNFPNDNLTFLIHPKMNKKDIDEIQLYCYSLNIKTERTNIRNKFYYSSDVTFHARSSHLGLELYELGGNVLFAEPQNNWIFQAIVAYEKTFPNNKNRYLLRSSIILSTHFFPLVENFDTDHALINDNSRSNITSLIDTIKLYVISEDVNEFGYDHLRIIDKWGIKHTNNIYFFDGINLDINNNNCEHLINNLYLFSIFIQLNIFESQRTINDLLKKIVTSSDILLIVKIQSLKVIDSINNQIDKKLEFEKIIDKVLYQYLNYLRLGGEPYVGIDKVILCPLNYGFYKSSNKIIEIIEMTAKWSLNNASFFPLTRSLRSISSFLKMAINYRKAFLTRSFGGDFIGKRDPYISSISELENTITLTLRSFKIDPKFINFFLILMRGKIEENNYFKIEHKKRPLNFFFKIGLLIEILKNYEYLSCSIGVISTNEIIREFKFSDIPKRLFIYNKLNKVNKINKLEHLINNFSKKFIKTNNKSQIDKINIFIDNHNKIQPGILRGLVVNLTGGCKNSQGTFYEQLNHWTRKGFLAVDPFCLAGKLLPNINDNFDLIEQFKDLHIAAKGLSTKRYKVSINLTNREILYNGINLYQGIYERLSTYFRRYDINLDNIEEQYQFNIELIRCFRFITIHHELERLKKKFNIPIFAVMGNSHVSPYSVIRDLSKISSYHLLILGFPYERLFTDKFTNYTENYKISLYKNGYPKRAPFLCSKDEFHIFLKNKYKIKNYNDYKLKIDSWLSSRFTKKNSSKIIDSLNKYQSWRKKYPNGRVFLVLGKISVDIGLPIDGGPVFRDYKSYVKGISDYSKKNNDSFFIFRPHPQELIKETALTLSDYMTNWINLDLDNVMLGGIDHELNELKHITDIVLIYNGSSIMEYTAIGKKVAAFSYYAANDYPINVWIPVDLDELKSKDILVQANEISLAKDLLIKSFFFDNIMRSTYFKFGAHNLSTFTPILDIHNSPNKEIEKINKNTFDDLFNNWNRYY